MVEPGSETVTPKPANAAAIRWAHLLRCTYDIEAERCGTTMRPVAVIVEPKVVRQILTHLGLPSEPVRLAPARGPPHEDNVAA